MAFVSLTFLIEVLATANAWQRTQPGPRKRVSNKGSCPTEKAGGDPGQIKIKTDVLCPPLFEIEQKLEMGYMSELFLGIAGSTCFYAVLCLYLYGVSNPLKQDLDINHITPDTGKSKIDKLQNYKVSEIGNQTAPQ